MGLEASDIAPVIGGMIGSYWGFAGQMIGSALGSMLFPPKESGFASPYSDKHKDTRILTKIDVVPTLYGTDICPGQIIWLDPYMTMREHTAYGNEYLNNWADGFEMDFGMFHIHFIMCFCGTDILDGNYSSGGGDYGQVSRLWLDKKHHWLWLRFNDYIKSKAGYVAGDWNDFTNIMYNYTPGWSTLNPESQWTPFSHITPVRWWGAMLYPYSQKICTSIFWDLERKKEAGLQDFTVATQPPTSFPDLRAEITDSAASGALTPFSGSGAMSSNVYISYRDNDCHEAYGMYSTFRSEDSGEPWYGTKSFFYRTNFYQNNTTLLYQPGDFWNNFAKTAHDNQEFYRQDIDGDPDRLYFVRCRNWTNGGKRDHHHANYSLEYYIYYLDRKDDTLHSVCYGNQISVGGFDGEDGTDSQPNARLKMSSMEIAGDEILLFGSEYQTHSIWDDQRTITADSIVVEGNKTIIYADWSAYPSGYWATNYGLGAAESYQWAYVYDGTPGHSYRQVERYRILEQTDTYLKVEGVFAILPEAGWTVYVTRIRGNQASWSIVGEGSTKDEIIAYYPSPFAPQISGQQYDSCQFENRQDTGILGGWGFEITGHSGTKIYLKNELPEVPTPGEIIWFTHEHWLNGISYPSDSGSSAYEKYFDPYDWWFMQNLLYLGSHMTYIYKGYFTDCFTAIPNLYGFIANNWKYFNHGLWNGAGYGKAVALRFSKTTGEYLGKLGEWGFYPYAYTGNQFICTGDAVATSCATDSQIAVSFAISQPYTYITALNVVYNKSPLGMREPYWYGYNQTTGGSHACGKLFLGAVKVRAWDDVTNTYSYRWYAWVREYMARHREPYMYDAGNLGHYLLDLGEEGIFPNVAEPLDYGDHSDFSSILNMDANLSNQIKWYRMVVYTGMLYSDFLFVSTRNESPYIRMFDYDQKIIMYLTRGDGFSNENWCYHQPNEYNKYGFSWPMYMGDEDWAEGYGTGSCSFKYYTGLGANSNFVDAYPIQVASAIMNQYTSEGIPSTYTDSQDYCEEVVYDIVNYCGNEIAIREPRFMFSMCYSKRQKVMDVIEDILATCQGMIFNNCSSSGYRIRLPMPNEEPIWYFGYDKQDFTASQTSGYYDRIYADFSSYPDDYWKGDVGHIIKNNVKYEFYVENQFDTYIELYISLSILVQGGDSFTIIKDNMEEGSFVFSKKPQFERANRVRIEFINRLLDYKIDIAEVDYQYKIDNVDGYVIQKQMEMHGIKRATQAARMALRYLDYEQFVNWLCSFRTDVMGNYFCIGDVIGITHPVTGWYAKPFRILHTEQGEDYENTIETEEYVSDVYHDYSQPVYQGGGGGSGGGGIVIPNDIPDAPRRLYAYHDVINNKVFVAFYTPANNNFIMGTHIFVSVDGGSYIDLGVSLTPIASVVYSEYPGTTTTSDMTPTRTKYNEMCEIGYQYTDIPYDPLTMLGSFPASGYLWVNGEMIYYAGIDTTNYKFVNCVRCIEYQEVQYAVDAPDDGFNWTNPLIVLADMANCFSFSIDPTWIDLTAESSQTEGSQIEYDVPTLTIKATSINSFGLESYGDTTYDLRLTGAVGGRPYSPTLLRCDRDI